MSRERDPAPSAAAERAAAAAERDATAAERDATAAERDDAAPECDATAAERQRPPLLKRRAVLYGGTAALCAGMGGLIYWDRREHFMHGTAVVTRVPRYDEALLVDSVTRGLQALGLGQHNLRGKRVLLKPNLVEPSREAPHINTNPTLVRAAVEAFRRAGCSELAVAEGPGHVRDTQLVLEESGLGPVLARARVPFIDINHQATVAVPNRLGLTTLKQLHLPRVLQGFDLLVSMPKMKTHHWAGVTLSMKNLFGVLPGVVYGWPKNVLHQHGIERSILDITATVRPDLCIVDGVVGMEGDGPIMGQPKRAGLLVLGQNPAAVDATCARLMGFDPRRLPYLAAASGRIGPIRAANIEQRGEALAPLVTPFRLVDHPLMQRFEQARKRG